MLNINVKKGPKSIKKRGFISCFKTLFCRLLLDADLGSFWRVFVFFLHDNFDTKEFFLVKLNKQFPENSYLVLLWRQGQITNDLPPPDVTADLKFFPAKVVRLR